MSTRITSVSATNWGRGRANGIGPDVNGLVMVQNRFGARELLETVPVGNFAHEVDVAGYSIPINKCGPLCDFCQHE